VSARSAAFIASVVREFDALQSNASVALANRIDLRIPSVTNYLQGASGDLTRILAGASQTVDVATTNQARQGALDRTVASVTSFLQGLIRQAQQLTTQGGVSAGGGIASNSQLVPNELGALRDSGPVVIDGQSNVVLRGLKISGGSTACVIIRNSTNVQIIDSDLSACGNYGVLVENSAGVTVAGNNVRGIAGPGVMLRNSTNPQAYANFIDGVYVGLRAVGSTGVKVELNRVLNARGPYPDGQAVQFDSVNGTGNRIQCNIADMATGGPDPQTTRQTAALRTEDLINIWKSNGTPDDPIFVGYNRLQGGGSFTGSGIMSGDGGGSWISVIGNRIVNPWNAGLGVAGGQNIRIEANQVYSAQPNHVANEGFYIRNFYPPACTNIVHQNNAITWPPTDGSTAGWTQTFWQPPGECTNVTGTETNNLNATLSPAIFSQPIAECSALASSRGLNPAGW
jgi:parallel beta-helix repeat protein